jgi:hypothetical protein
VAPVIPGMILQELVHLVTGDVDLMKIVRVMTDGALVMVVIVLVVMIVVVMMIVIVVMILVMVVVMILVVVVMVIMMVLVFAFGEGPLLLAGRTLVIGER